jgi:hypothetical protein
VDLISRPSPPSNVEHRMLGQVNAVNIHFSFFVNASADKDGARMEQTPNGVEQAVNQ